MTEQEKEKRKHQLTVEELIIRLQRYMPMESTTSVYATDHKSGDFEVTGVVKIPNGIRLTSNARPVMENKLEKLKEEITKRRKIRPNPGGMEDNWRIEEMLEKFLEIINET